MLFYAFYMFISAHDQAWRGFFSQDATNQVNLAYFCAFLLVLGSIAIIGLSGFVFWLLYTDYQKLSNAEH